MKLEESVQKFIIILIIREYYRMFDQIRRTDLNTIAKLTNCIKPCKYKKYSLLGDRKPSDRGSVFPTDDVAFSLWAVSENTRVATEQLVYPLSSLIAEFGGTLSLFFVTIWDNFCLFSVIYRIVIKKRNLRLM